VVEAARDLPVAHETDVLVVGGGIAGVMAALAAGRTGARTLLVERFGSLGGTGTAAMMNLFYVPYAASRGLVRELFDRLIARGGAIPGEFVVYDPELYKVTALEMLAEANVRVLLHTLVSDVVMDGRGLRGIIVENKSGRQAILSRVAVDASGDADVAARAGAPYIKGRERDGKMRPMTLIFRMGGVDVPRLVEYVRAHPDDFSPDPLQCMLDLEHHMIRIFGFFKLVEAAKARGELWPDCYYFRVESVLPDRGVLTVNATRVYGVDGTSGEDLSRAEIETRHQMIQLANWARAHVPGFERSFILDSAHTIGVRETRRIRGEYVMTEEDILAGRRYDDAVAVDANQQNPRQQGGHPPDGQEGGIQDLEAREMVARMFVYEIPYGCLVPREVDGLLVAGRCISVDHHADVYTRNQGSAMATGVAAGVAGALAARAGIPPRTVDVRAVQGALGRLGVDLDLLRRLGPTPASLEV
jgi:FAD-dependent oxidoreductase family protein